MKKTMKVALLIKNTSDNLKILIYKIKWIFLKISTKKMFYLNTKGNLLK